MRSVKHTALCLLRRIAASETQEEYDIAIQALHKDPIWISTNSIKFKSYIENTWLPEKKRWVKAFRSGILETVVNTNNGVERKNRDFKHEFLNQYKDNSLSGMVTVLVDQFIPETYSRYVEANIRRCSDYRLYNSNLPKWLCNKPENFTRHCIEKFGLVKDCNNLKITFHENSKNKQMYEVKSFTSAKSYIVTIGGQDTKFPDCQCIEWKKTLMPCKHMVAIFQHCDGVSWDLLPDSYRFSPYFCLDNSVIYGNESCHEEESNICFEDNLSETQGHVILENVQNKIYPKQTNASSCRDILSQIKTLSYLVYDEIVVKSLKFKLQEILNELQTLVPKHDNIPLERNEVTKKKRCACAISDKLPKPKILKTKFTEEKKEKQDIIEEYAPLDDFFYNIPIEPM
nr:uncharacterized protein LOC105848403 [Hydra vulgaris]